MKEIEIYQLADGRAEVQVQFDNDTVWLSLMQMTTLFGRDKSVISRHIRNIFKEKELDSNSTVANFTTVQNEGGRTVERNVEHYNLDVIISVGYRVKSKQGTQFRIWATQRLKDYLVQGYAINEKRVEQKNLEIHVLRNGIQIMERALAANLADEEPDMRWLRMFAEGLKLLDDYDHESLDSKGKTKTKAIYPSLREYRELIDSMRREFETVVFGKEKDGSFESSISQIAKGFGDVDLYPSIEEKAAVLLYLVVKNHSFVDGNKRIAASCFLKFLSANNMLLKENGSPIISNEALAGITLYIATSKVEEMEVVKNLVISVLNRR